MNSEIELRIERIGHKGDGIAKLENGDLVFVEGGLPGEWVRVGTLEEKRGGRAGYTASLLAVLEPSAQRRSAPCPFFASCGGCALQHMTEHSYQDFKQNRVWEALKRAGMTNMDGIDVEGPFVSAPGTRRRVVFSAKCDFKGNVCIGFNQRGSYQLAEISECMVMSASLNTILPLFRQYLPAIMKPDESYDLAVTESRGFCDILITVLGKKPRQLDEAVKTILKNFAQHEFVARLSWQSSRQRAYQVVFEQASFTVDLSGFAVSPQPGAFLQATVPGEVALTDFVCGSISRKARIADLYSGCGTFGLALLRQGHRVDCYEGNGRALDSLRNAVLGNPKLGIMLRDLAKEPLTFQELNRYDAIVVDPPRLGALKQFLEIGKSSVSKVLSVSCNPDTFARDSLELMRFGFKMRRIRVVDQFLWAPHVEIAALLTR